MSESVEGSGSALAYSASELAGKLRVSLRHLRRMHAAGKLPRPVRLGRSVRWSTRDIDTWLMAGAPDRKAWESTKRGA
jgi:excisionase family DNA binding protein